MSDNILVVSADQGETEAVSFREIADGNTLHTKFFEEFAKEHPEVANVRIEFDGVENTFNGLEGAQFPLDRAEKTLGTYVTRINKIVAGQDPDARQTRSGSGSSRSAKADVGIEQIDEESVRLFKVDGDSEATVNVEGEVTTNDFPLMSYYIEGVLNPVHWNNRIDKLRQFADGKEATPPEYTMSYKGIEVSMGDNKPSEEEVRKAHGQIAAKLFEQGETFEASELQNTKPEMTGGGEEWLQGWLEQAYPELYAEDEAEEEAEVEMAEA